MKAAQYSEGVGSGRARAALRAMVLPDFCTREAVFAAVLLGELLAVLVTLAEWRPWDDLLTPLALNSLFVLWVALFSCALLCWLGRRLTHHGAALTFTVAWLGILAVAWALSELAWLLAGEPVFGGTVTAGSRLSFLLRNLGLTALIAALSLRYLYLQQAWRCQVIAEADARLAALQARIRPHFLFNSLNTIAALVAADPKQAEGAVEDLADLFRAALASPEDLAPLADELLLCERYLALEKLRLGERLQVEWALAADLPRAAVVPPLLLQPLLENAIYHAIEGLPAGGLVRIEGFVRGAQMHFTVENPCADAPSAPPAAESPGVGLREHLGIALANIQDRLAAHYGTAGGLATRRAAGHFHVHIWWPVE